MNGRVELLSRRGGTLLGRSLVVLRGLDDASEMSDIGPNNWCSAEVFQYGSMIQQGTFIT